MEENNCRQNGGGHQHQSLMLAAMEWMRMMRVKKLKMERLNINATFYAIIASDSAKSPSLLSCLLSALAGWYGASAGGSKTCKKVTKLQVSSMTDYNFLTLPFAFLN